MPMEKNPPANERGVRDTGSIPGSGRSPGGGHGNPLQYSCLENPMDRGTWWVTVHGVSKSWTRLKRLSTHARRRNTGRVHLTDRWCEEVQVIHCGQDLGAARDSERNRTAKLSVTWQACPLSEGNMTFNVTLRCTGKLGQRAREGLPAGMQVRRAARDELTAIGIGTSRRTERVLINQNPSDRWLQWMWTGGQGRKAARQTSLLQVWATEQKGTWFPF